LIIDLRLVADLSSWSLGLQALVRLCSKLTTAVTALEKIVRSRDREIIPGALLASQAALIDRLVCELAAETLAQQQLGATKVVLQATTNDPVTARLRITELEIETARLRAQLAAAQKATKPSSSSSIQLPNKIPRKSD
jgi:hypothetical protein